MATISRNQTCHCGSGKRYKHCCGEVAAAPIAPRPIETSWRNTMNAALGKQRAGQLADAEALYRSVLATRPEEADALHMLGVICFQTGRFAEALALILRAIDCVPGPVPALYGNLALALHSAVSGKNLAHAARLRMAYADFQKAPSHGKSSPLVSIVVPVATREDLDAALQAVRRQTYPDIELVVITPAAMTEGDIAAASASKPAFALRHLSIPGFTRIGAINHGLSNAAGEFINVLLPGDGFADARIEKMVHASRRGAGQWGFSMVAAESAVATHGATGGQERISGEHTIGFALLLDESVVGCVSNLFFSRDLLQRVGGFADLPNGVERDFALRAVFAAEPFYVDEALCLMPAQIPAADGKQQILADCMRRFYETACLGSAGDFGNANVPAWPVWQDRFIYHVATLNHLHLLPASTVRRFVERGIALQGEEAVASPELLPGLDLVSFFNAEIGLAESARSIAKSCMAGGIPFAARSIDMRMPQRCADRSMDPWITDTCRHAAIVFMVNPDALTIALRQLSGNENSQRYRIGFWYWETEKIPEQWRQAVEMVDEIWVATEFVATALRQFTSKPVVRIHPPVEVSLERLHERTAFGLDRDRFLFLFTFDYSSFASRKNAQAAIDAFQRAFAADDQRVGLVIKSQNGRQSPEKLRALELLAAKDPRIRLIDQAMSRDDVFGLQSVCDAFLSLHRSEGFGLGLAECMAQGKPVIATAYSGNMEFMNEENSCLVGYDMIPIRAGEYLYDQVDVAWADPHIDAAAAHMRRLVDDPAYCSRIGAAARDYMARNWNHECTAQAIRARMAQLDLSTTRLGHRQVA